MPVISCGNPLRNTPMNILIVSFRSTCEPRNSSLPRDREGRCWNSGSARSTLYPVLLLSFQGGINVPGYAASKGAIASLLKSFANEWAAHGITVNGGVALRAISADQQYRLICAPIREKKRRDPFPDTGGTLGGDLGYDGRLCIPVLTRLGLCEWDDPDRGRGLDGEVIAGGAAAGDAAGSRRRMIFKLKLQGCKYVFSIVRQRRAG